MSGAGKTGRWKLPAFAGGGGIVGSCVYATHAGHLPIAVTVTVGAIIGVLMSLASVISNVMPQKSEHRNEVVQGFLEHRRKMEVLRQKRRARTEAKPISITVQVVPAPRPAPDLSIRAARPRRHGTLPR